MLIESVGRMIVQAHSNKHQFAWVNKKKTPKRIVCISQHIHTLRGMASETVEFFCRGGRFIFSMIDFMSQHNRNKNNNTYNNNHSLAGQSDTMRKKKLRLSTDHSGWTMIEHQQYQQLQQLHNMEPESKKFGIFHDCYQPKIQTSLSLCAVWNAESSECRIHVCTIFAFIKTKNSRTHSLAHSAFKWSSEGVC